ncbi:MAG: hypothetical protein JXB62_20870 [Pirellulales bacterium]|nr:hypothetical protein [Pirellulales bacterium]
MFTARTVLNHSIRFVAVFVLAWSAAQGGKLLAESAGIAVDVQSRWWPLSCFQWKVPGVRAPWSDLGRAAGTLAAFYAFVQWFLRRVTGSAALVVLAGLFFVIGTNLIHGAHYGLAHPHVGSNQDSPGAARQYYHDATQVASAGQFLRDFEKTQSTLGCHSRTHPPGAVLLIYGLAKCVRHPTAISLVMAALSVGLSGCFLYRILSRELDPDTCGYVTLLFLLIPAVQVYYCATLDAVIASCCLGVLAYLRRPNPILGGAGMITWLFCASLLSFGACFLVPVVVGFELVTRRSVRRSVAVVLGVAALYTVVYLLWGFNYLGAFSTASALENPGGFLALSEPVSYAITRVENVADIVLFFGPFLLVLSARGISELRRHRACSELLTLTGLGVLTLLAMFLAGTFRTGETARACLFIYPYLMFPVACHLHHRGYCDADMRLLLWLVFGQSLAMQTLGGYCW